MGRSFPVSCLPRLLFFIVTLVFPAQSTCADYSFLHVQGDARKGTFSNCFFVRRTPYTQHIVSIWDAIFSRYDDDWTFCGGCKCSLSSSSADDLRFLFLVLRIWAGIQSSWEQSRVSPFHTGAPRGLNLQVLLSPYCRAFLRLLEPWWKKNKMQISLWKNSGISSIAFVDSSELCVFQNVLTEMGCLALLIRNLP